MKVSIKKCGSYNREELGSGIKDLVERLGGIGAFVKKGESVLVKPNLLSNSEPSSGINTHPEFVRAVVRILKTVAGDIAIGDIPGDHGSVLDIDRLYSVSGMEKVAAEEGVRLVKHQKYEKQDEVLISSWVKEFDKIISLPKFKTHALMVLTGAVKNVFGLTPRIYRLNLHRLNPSPKELARVLVDVYEKAKPALSIVDGIVAMEGNGPGSSGEIKNLGFIGASADAVALDSVMAKIMGLEPRDIFTTKQAEDRGLGTADLTKIEILGDRIDDFMGGTYKLPPVSVLTKAPLWMLNILGGLAKLSPKVLTALCTSCKTCIESCPVEAISLDKGKAKVDYSKCVSCFCCVEVCPYGAMKTKEGPLFYAIKIRNLLRRIKVLKFVGVR